MARICRYGEIDIARVQQKGKHRGRSLILNSIKTPYTARHSEIEYYIKPKSVNRTEYSRRKKVFL